jgi:hypothetical protein
LCVHYGATAHNAKDCTTFESRGCQTVSQNVFNIYNRFKPSGFDKFKQFYNNNNKRSRSSSRSRSRSRGFNHNSFSDNTANGNNSASTSTSQQKSVSYADATNSLLNAFIHSSNHSNNNSKQQRSHIQNPKPQFSDSKRMQLKLVLESLGKIAKELNTLQSEYNNMASRFNRIKARLDAFEFNSFSSPVITQNKRREPGRIHPSFKPNVNQFGSSGLPI